MSIRAYKVIKKQLEKKPTFNLWSDRKVMASLNGEGVLESLIEGVGTFEIERETIELLLREAETEREQEIYNQMLKDCERNTCVEYECY